MTKGLQQLRVRWYASGAWRYACLLLLLLVLAAFAALSTLQYLEEHAVFHGCQGTPRGLTWSLLALTMGFLFLAGAMGLWAIRSTTETETRRRVSHVVDSMTYLADGLVAVDPQGRVSGANPAARLLASCDFIPRRRLRDLFPFLTEADRNLLLDSASPREVERDRSEADRSRTFRFRSQPLKGLILILVSDISEARTRREQERQMAQLQLLGRISRGVAHDFNNILCAISGFAELLERDEDGRVDKESMEAIQREAERGTVLAGHLRELSHSGDGARRCEDLEAHLEMAASTLRLGLPPEWLVETRIEGTFSRFPLTTVQFEQIVTNLGLLAADRRERPGTLTVRASSPPPGPEGFNAVVVVAAADQGTEPPGPDGEAFPRDEHGQCSGVIESVLATLLNEIGGRLENLDGGSGCAAYRFCLPRIDMGERRPVAIEEFGDVAKEGIKGWKVLLGLSEDDEQGGFVANLEQLGVEAILCNDIVTILERVEQAGAFDAMVLDKDILGAEADGLLRAILKLQPDSGIVVLCQSPEEIPDELADDIYFASFAARQEAILRSMIRAREQAAQRGGASSA